MLWRFSENVSDGLGIIGGICPARSLATDGTEIATSPILAQVAFIRLNRFTPLNEG